MNQFLQKGGNVALSQASGYITISYKASSTVDVSLTAFLLTAAETVQGDSGIIFYNQPLSESGVATLLDAKLVNDRCVHTLQFDLAKAPADIMKIAVTLTEDNHTGFTNVTQLKAEIHTADDIIELAPAQFDEENGIVVLELYLRNGQPKAKSIWQGFNSGLAGLCANFGVETEEEPPPPTINLEKVTGNVSLEKGQKAVIIEKTPIITATVSWKTGTDYDIYALVYTKNGQQVDVAMFGAKGVPSLQSYKGVVEHLGDVGRTKDAIKTEVIKLQLNDEIVAVVPVVYSAQSNGSGSFSRYKVSMSIDNHSGTSVTIAAENANNNDSIYTCVPGILQNTVHGVMITPLELYSKPKSERRPKLQMAHDNLVEVLMDAGPVNNYK